MQRWIETEIIEQEIAAAPGPIIHKGKVLARIIDKYDLDLTEQERHSLEIRIGFQLSRKKDAGLLEVYTISSSGSRPIRYIKKS